MEPSETARAAAAVSTATDVLSIEHLYGGYGRKQVVFDVNVHVGRGEIVTLLGHNGSGKTTTIRTVLGLNPAHDGRVVYHGRDVTRAGFRANVKAGMAMIPSERFVFADMSVTDNLLLGGANDPDADRRAKRLELVHDG